MDITDESYQEANSAIRDILFMYVDLVESYSGFGHNIDTGSFDPLDFIDANVLGPDVGQLGINLCLLNSGAGIALLCQLSDAWDEHGTWDVEGWGLMRDIKEAFLANRFSHMPVIEKAIGLGFGESEKAFRDQLKIVFEYHVRAYFRRLA